MHPLPLLVLAMMSLSMSDSTPSPDRAPDHRPQTQENGDSTTVVIAHRGASGHAHEHTWAAYELAMEMRADILEPDLQMTRDGHLIAFHDETLDRTARGPAEFCTGPVIDRTLEEIRHCDVGRWFNEEFPDRARPEFEGQRVVTLDELFGRWGGQVRWYPETKNPAEAPGMEGKLIELIERHGLRDAAVTEGQVLIQSFSRESLLHLRTLDSQLPLVQLLRRSALVGRDAASLMAEIAEYAIGVGPSRYLVDEAFMEAASANGLVVHPWTVNEVDEMERFIGMGVDGIFTDFPDRLRALLDERAGPRQ